MNPRKGQESRLGSGKETKLHGNLNLVSLLSSVELQAEPVRFRQRKKSVKPTVVIVNIYTEDMLSHYHHVSRILGRPSFERPPGHDVREKVRCGEARGKGQRGKQTTMAKTIAYCRLEGLFIGEVGVEIGE